MVFAAALAVALSILPLVVHGDAGDVYCQWAGDAVCLATMDGPNSEEYASVTANYQICISNMNSDPGNLTGCLQEMEMCKSIPPFGNVVGPLCLPASWPTEMVQIPDLTAMQTLLECGASTDDSCNGARLTLYTTLGCPACADIANAAAPLAAECAAYATEAECTAAGTGGAAAQEVAASAPTLAPTMVGLEAPTMAPMGAEFEGMPSEDAAGPMPLAEPRGGGPGGLEDPEDGAAADEGAGQEEGEASAEGDVVASTGGATSLAAAPAAAALLSAAIAALL